MSPLTAISNNSARLNGALEIPNHEKKCDTREKRTPPKTHWVSYLNKVQLRLQFRKSLDLQISSIVGCFKKTNAFLVHFIYVLMKLFTLNGVYIKAYDKLKMA